jgi:hypothetical protein
MDSLTSEVVRVEQDQTIPITQVRANLDFHAIHIFGSSLPESCDGKSAKMLAYQEESSLS